MYFFISILEKKNEKRESQPTRTKYEAKGLKSLKQKTSKREIIAKPVDTAGGFVVGDYNLYNKRGEDLLKGCTPVNRWPKIGINKEIKKEGLHVFFG